MMALAEEAATVRAVAATVPGAVREDFLQRCQNQLARQQPRRPADEEQGGLRSQGKSSATFFRWPVTLDPNEHFAAVQPQQHGKHDQ